MKPILTLLLVVSALLANAQSSLPPAGQDPTQSPVRWSTVAEGLNSRITQGDQRIITNDNDWQALYARMAGDPASRTPAPRLADFSRQDLVVLHTGTKPNPGHRVYVYTISRPRVGVKQIEVKIVSPPPGYILPQQTVNPYVIIAVDRAPGNYEFKAINVTEPPKAIVGGNNCACTCGKCCHHGNHSHHGQATYDTNHIQRVRQEQLERALRTGQGDRVDLLPPTYHGGLELFPALHPNRQGSPQNNPFQSGGRELFPPLTGNN